jgi:uncharacterized protein (TIGR02145 family)
VFKRRKPGFRGDSAILQTDAGFASVIFFKEVGGRDTVIMSGDSVTKITVWLDADKKLKTTSGWDASIEGTDNFGFSAIPSGYGGRNGNRFSSLGYYSGWWEFTQYDRYIAYGWELRASSDYVRSSLYSKDNSFSVRCRKE